MGSAKFAINWNDLVKALRVGLFALLGSFVTGVVGVAPTLNLATLDPNAIWKVLVLAGLTAVFDLIRRWLTDQSGTVTVTEVTPQ